MVYGKILLSKPAESLEKPFAEHSDVISIAFT